MSRDTKMLLTFRARETTASVFVPIASSASRRTRRRGSYLYRIASQRKCCGFDRQPCSYRLQNPWHCAATLVFLIMFLAEDRSTGHSSPACVSSLRERRHQSRGWTVDLFRSPRRHSALRANGRRRDREPLSAPRNRLKQRTIARRKPSRPDSAPLLRCRSYVAHTARSLRQMRYEQSSIAICRRFSPPRIGFHESENHPRGADCCLRSKLGQGRRLLDRAARFHSLCPLPCPLARLSKAACSGNPEPRARGRACKGRIGAIHCACD